MRSVLAALYAGMITTTFGLFSTVTIVIIQVPVMCLRAHLQQMAQGAIQF